MEISSVSELTASSSQNSLIGGQAASSSQNSMTGGCGSGESILTTGGTEGIPRSDLWGGGGGGGGGGSCKYLLGAANFHWSIGWK